MTGTVYRFEDFELDTARHELRRAGVPVHVEPQVFALITLLLERHPEVVGRDAINQAVWGGRPVTESALDSRVRSARAALGDDGRTQRLIRTVHRRGLRFEVRPEVQSPTPSVRAAGNEVAAAPATPSPDGGQPSIAVLPLVMLGEDPRYGALADAVSHDIIVDLSRLRWLKVIARGSCFRFRGPDVDPLEVRRVLGVRYLVAGSVAIVGAEARLTLELSEPASGEVVWADAFVTSLRDLMALRADVTARIATAIEVRIQHHEGVRAARLSTEHLDAWAAYHRGLWHMYRFNPRDNALAQSLFRHATALDPRFARAWSALSFTHFQNAFIGFTDDVSGETLLARRHAETGLDLDPHDPFTNLTMGRSVQLHGDVEASIGWYEQSSRLSPSYAFAIYNRALAESITGDGPASERHAMQAIGLSPIDPLHYAMLGTRALSHMVRGEHAEAAEWGERAARQPTAHAHIHIIAALTRALAGDERAAHEWVRRIRAERPDLGRVQFFRAFPFRDPATRAQAEATLVRLGL